MYSFFMVLRTCGAELKDSTQLIYEGVKACFKPSINNIATYTNNEKS